MLTVWLLNKHGNRNKNLRMLNSKIVKYFQKIFVFLAKIWDLVLPSIIKFEVCGDILVTRIFEEFWYFTTRENGTISGSTWALRFSGEKQIQQRANKP